MIYLVLLLIRRISYVITLVKPMRQLMSQPVRE